MSSYYSQTSAESGNEETYFTDLPNEEQQRLIDELSDELFSLSRKLTIRIGLSVGVLAIVWSPVFKLSQIPFTLQMVLAYGSACLVFAPTLISRAERAMWRELKTTNQTAEQAQARA